MKNANPFTETSTQGKIAGQNGGQSSQSSYQSPSIRRDIKQLKRFCVKQYKIIKYTIWLTLAIQLIPATAAEAFFLPLIIQAILPKSHSPNSTSLHPIQRTFLDFHSNFGKLGKTIFTPLKLTPLLLIRQQYRDKNSTYSYKIQSQTGYSMPLWLQS